MRVTHEDVHAVFTALISGKIDRESADCWAHERMEAFDAEQLEFEPTEDEAQLWDAIMYLLGIDMQIAPGEYMHSIEDIREQYEKRWKRHE